MKFYELNSTGNTNLPKWMRSFGIDMDGGIFVPAEYSGQGEMETMLCASYDGISISSYRGHTFVPLAWLEKEFPKRVVLCFFFLPFITNLFFHIIKAMEISSSESHK